MKAWVVRAVDSGNIQRSPTFQAIFSYFYSNALPFPVLFDSAGMDVDKIMANATPVPRQLEIIDAGRYYDIIKGDNKLMADELSDKWSGKSDGQIPAREKERITRLYSEVKTDIHRLQMQFRNEALTEAGIPEKYLPGMRVPFRHGNHLSLVLPVEESVVRKVDDYYRSVGDRQPTTRLYADLAGISPLRDELTGGIETARKQVEYFMDTREKAMSEILLLISGYARQ